MKTELQPLGWNENGSSLGPQFQVDQTQPVSLLFMVPPSGLLLPLINFVRLLLA